MAKQLVDMVLPRLAKTLYRELKRYRAGKLDEAQFTRCFENLLQKQHSWLLDHGVSDVKAALAIHAAVLVLSSPGLRAEASESGQPLELIEFRAVREAAGDVAHNYGIDAGKAFRLISKVVARYGG
jgi:Flp pilus assembly CpaE family ATPase